VTELILALDQGTTNTKGLLIARDGTIVARASRPMTVRYPRPGWAELDAVEIWQTVSDVISELSSAVAGRPIAAVAISNQRESVTVWDAATGAPIGPCLLWQCRRSADICARLRDAGHEAAIVERSGLGLDPMFPAAKIAWLLDSVPGARLRAEKGELLAGTVDSWLVWKLTGGRHVTDHSNASRTQLLNLDALCWDPTLAEIFRVPLAVLPEVICGDGPFGDVAVGSTALPPGIPIRAVLGDSHAALYGYGFREPGRVKVTCGTGSSLMLTTAKRIRSTHRLSETVAWSTGGKAVYALEGNILVSGQTAAFVTKLLGLTDEDALSALAQTVPDSNGVVFVPALAGLGAPHWCDTARGLISGMSLGTTSAHLACAAFDAIAMQIRDVFVAMQADLNAPLRAISMDGGAARNDFLIQRLADLLGCPVERSPVTELSAMGVARLAAETLGWDVENWLARATQTVFEPKIDAAERENAVIQWQAALRRATLSCDA
jgi:glycerol kinase